MRRALLGVVALVLLALAATALWPPQEADGPVAPAETSFDWQARIALLAGDGHRGVRDGALVRARFDEPWGLVRGPDGSLFAADGGEANRIRRIAPDGTVQTLAGAEEGFADGIGTQAKFHTPSSLAVDSHGNLYVADTGNHAVRRISPDGKVTTLAGDGSPGFRDGPGAQARFHGPMGVAVDALGRVFVADTWNDRIRVIDPDGSVRTLAGGDRPGFRNAMGLQARFDTPTGLALDSEGRLWVADTGNGALRRVDPDGLVDTWRPSPWEDFETGLGRPLAIAASHDGHLYVAELSPGRVLQLSPDGRIRVLTGGHERQWFARPSALWLETDGSLLLADAAGHRLHRLAPRIDGSADSATGPDPERLLPATAGRWPLAPQDGWHEVVGTLGEVRGNFRGESRSHLHNGLDIRGDVGAQVLSIADAKVSSPLAAWSFGGQAEGIATDELTYLHLRVGRTPWGANLDPEKYQFVHREDGRPERVRIARGTRFAVGEALGTINAQAHVHLIVGPYGHQLNAIRLGLVNYIDTVAPRIEGIMLLDGHDRLLERRSADGRVLVPGDGGGVQVVVDAWDQVDGNLARRRLGLHRVGWQILAADGSMLPGHTRPMMNIDFSRMPAHSGAVKVAYAANSGITVHGAARTRFLYVANNHVRAAEMAVTPWQPGALPPGDYLIRVFGEDASGNQATGPRDLPIRITP
ncbi:NHL repeat-containing protein [Luteimonas sp. MJ293]|uniref:NHL repeat-containing protein n=1 Tax=Luteimonas sp. MJ146 TaxID=3129240 RepID=UPI0031BABD8E